MTTPDNTPTRDATPPSLDTHPAAASTTDRHLQNLYELGAEAVGHLISRDRDERRWKVVKRTVLSGAVLGGLALSFALYAPMLGWSSAPSTKVLGVIPINGTIGQGDAAPGVVIQALERACSSSQVEAVVLRINSPGGSPSAAERIAVAVDACRAPGPDGGDKTVIALIEGVGASAAYMIAVRADEVLSGRYSVVGSIGAVMRTMDAEGALAKLGVKERVYASGDLKAMNSPWTPNTPEQDQIAQSMVDEIAGLFVSDVQERRGDKLVSTLDMFSGRVWVGTTAAELGLTDGLATFEGLKSERFKGLPVHEFRPTQTLQDKMGLSTLVREFGTGVAAGLEGVSWE